MSATMESNARDGEGTGKSGEEGLRWRETLGEQGAGSGGVCYQGIPAVAWKEGKRWSDDEGIAGWGAKDEGQAESELGRKATVDSSQSRSRGRSGRTGPTLESVSRAI